MANIGNQLSTNNFVCDTFSGTGSQTTFTPLTFAPASVASIAVFVGGSYQAPTTYSLSGTSLVFASAPTAGTGNIRVLHLGTGSVSQVPADGSVSNTKIYATGTANSSTFLRGDNSWAIVNMNSITGDLTVSGNTTTSGTGFTKLATGTTAERPSSNSAGYIRYNTTRGFPEYWDSVNSTWLGIGAFQATGGTITTSGSNTIHTFTSSGTFQVLSGTKNIEVLVVAGGGQGGNGSTAGGGGAGGVVYSSSLSVSAGSYTATVGATSSSVTNYGATGNPSSFPGLTTALGGGGGAGGPAGYPGAGGSGGGAGPASPVGAGTPGQGNPGGSGLYGSVPTYYADGGGGGAGSAGGNSPSPTAGGSGGSGVAYSISGSSVTYAGGGGGGGWSRPGADAISPGPAGPGGGGVGYPSNRSPSPVQNGTNGLGGGGGSGNSSGGLGGSGVIIIRYATS
jgi:hypothetical protein